MALHTVEEKNGSGLGSRRQKSATVLVAEDDAAMRNLIVDWLLAAGYSVISCATGDELVDQLSYLSREEYRCREYGTIDLIITDIRMPGRDGLDALESLWSLPLPPIIVITAFGDDDTRARADDFGVSMIIAKPFDHDELMIPVAVLTTPRS